MRAMKNYAGHRLSPWLGHFMVSRQETARPLLTQGEVMQLPSADELVLVSGMQPIRAKKARYYEDRRLQERNLPLPSLTDSVKESPKVRHHDWSAQPLIALDLKLATGGASDEDPDNAGIWPEPTLPEHEAIAAEFLQPADAFATLVDEADDGPVLANILRQRMRPLRGKLPSTVATVSIFEMP
jgi:type IV secretion system protein VirD4